MPFLEAMHKRENGQTDLKKELILHHILLRSIASINYRFKEPQEKPLCCDPILPSLFIWLIGW
jgi:hypothetical protein